MKPPLLIPKAFPDDFCDYLVAYHRGHPEYMQPLPETDPWYNRVIGHHDLVKDEKILSFLCEWVSYCDRNIQTYFGPQGILYPNTITCVKWFPGQDMRPHIDDANGFWFRQWSAVMYLNDDYKDGEIWFPRVPFTLKPKKGDLVLFSSTGEHIHGVKPASAERFTLSMWFTSTQLKSFNLPDA